MPGVDLQVEVHEDMAANFGAYPKMWGLTRPDRNIDHRRVPNLETLFQAQGRGAGDQPERGRLPAGRHCELAADRRRAAAYRRGDAQEAGRPAAGRAQYRRGHAGRGVPVQLADAGLVQVFQLDLTKPGLTNLGARASDARMMRFALVSLPFPDRCRRRRRARRMCRARPFARPTMRTATTIAAVAADPAAWMGSAWPSTGFM